MYQKGAQNLPKLQKKKLFSIKNKCKIETNDRRDVGCLLVFGSYMTALFIETINLAVGPLTSKSTLPIRFFGDLTS